MSEVSEIDLVILTYNREDTVGEALASVASWKFKRVICIDHHSTDRTIDIVKSFFPNVEVYYENAGLGYARTLAISLVTSPFFFFLDSDVVLSHDYLNSLKALMKPNVAAVHGTKETIHPIWKELMKTRLGSTGVLERGGYRILRTNDRPFTGATLIRTGAAKGANLSKYKMWEDYFLMRYVQQKGFVWIQAFMTVHLLEPETIAYGNLRSKRDENEGAAMRKYGIRTPLQFISEQVKYTIRDLFLAVKLGRLTYLSYVIRLHKSFVKGYLSPTRYLN